METDIKKWLKEGGQRFLKDIGIKEGQNILDFGCGSGTYTIPAAKIVGEQGRVYALDKDKKVLDKLMQKAKLAGLKNIKRMDTSGEPRIDLLMSLWM
jgi:precorrin-6B methylase 2